MRVLLLGGTGTMGKHLIDILSELKVDITVTSRSRSDKDAKASYIKGDARDRNFIDSLLKKNWDCIVDFMVYSTDDFRSRASILTSSTSQYIFLSSARVFADSQGPITESSSRLLDVSEDSFYLATDEYALTKARQENILSESTNKNWTIVRPYITYGDDRLQLGYLEKEQWLYRCLRGRSILLCSDIRPKLTTVTYGYDVARAIAALIGNPKAAGESFNITTNESLTWSDVLDVYSETIKDFTGICPNFILQDIDDTCSWYNLRYQITYDRMYNRVFDPQKISEHIDMSSFLKPREGLRRCLNNFLTQPMFLDINWVSEARKDAISKEYANHRELRSIRQKIRYITHRLGLK